MCITQYNIIRDVLCVNPSAFRCARLALSSRVSHSRGRGRQRLDERGMCSGTGGLYLYVMRRKKNYNKTRQVYNTADATNGVKKIQDSRRFPQFTDHRKTVFSLWLFFFPLYIYIPIYIHTNPHYIFTSETNTDKFGLDVKKCRNTRLLVSGTILLVPILCLTDGK